MWRPSIWILLISWVVAWTVLSFAKETMAQSPHAGITSSPASMIPTHADIYDRSIIASPTDTQAEMKSVGWAGIGDIPKTLQPPPPLPGFTKWIPDNQPVREKHWDAIMQALNVVRVEKVPLDINQEPTTSPPAVNLSLTFPAAAYSNWLPTNATSLAMLLHNGNKQMQDFTNSRYDSSRSIRNSHNTKIVPEGPVNGMITSTLFNPLEIFLPDHVKETHIHANKQQESPHTNRSQTFNAEHHNLQSGHFSNPITYIHWPNVGQGTKLNQALFHGQTFEDNSQELTQPKSPKTSEDTMTNEMKFKQQTKIVNSEMQATQHYVKQIPHQGNETKEKIKIPKNEMRITNVPLSSTVLVNQPYKQWPQLTHTHNHMALKHIKTEKPYINESRPSLSILHNLRQQNGQRTHSSPTNTLPTTTSPKYVNRDTRMTPTSNKIKHSTEGQQSSEFMNNKDLLQQEAKSQLTDNQNSKEKARGSVYTPPRLHTVVENDQLSRGFPYEEALRDLPPNYIHSSLSVPEAEHRKNYSFNIASVNNQDHMNKSLLSKVKAHHLAIVETPQKPINQPLHIRNVHVIAPKPDNIPPIPLFRPAEKKPLEVSPYVINDKFARASGQNGDNPMLVVPYPIQEPDLHDRSSNLYPIMIPLKKPSRRQDITRMIMQPIRDIFRIRSFPNDFLERRPVPPQQTARTPNSLQPPQIIHHQQLAPLTRLSPPPELREQPPSQSDSLFFIQFPGFGPPKGEDIVVMLNNKDQLEFTKQQLMESLKEPDIPKGILLSPPSQRLQHQPVPADPLTVEEVQAPSTVSTIPQFHSLVTPNVDETVFEGEELLAPFDVFKDDSQSLPANFLPLQQNQFQPNSFQSPPAMLEHFLSLQPSEIPHQTVHSNANVQPTVTSPPPFISWPNIQNVNPTGLNAAPGTSTISPSLSHTTGPQQPNFSLFNRFSNARPLRLPSFPNMNFLNPFNMFQSRENTQETSSKLPFLSSFFSKADNEPSDSMADNSLKDPTSRQNLTVQNLQQSSSATDYKFNNDSGIQFLKDIRNKRHGKGTFHFLPHLQPILNNKMTPPPPLPNSPTPIHNYSQSLTYSTSKPLVQPSHSTVHKPGTQQLVSQQPTYDNHHLSIQPLTNSYLLPSLREQNHGRKYQQLQGIRTNTSSQKDPNEAFDNFQENYVKISSPITLQKSQQNNIHTMPISLHHQVHPTKQREQMTKINPQTNPARPISVEPKSRQEIFGPDLIKFTIDDVVFNPPLSMQGNHQPKVAQITENGKKPTQIFSGEHDMDFSPTEEIITIAEYVQPSHSSNPPVLTMQRITPTPSTTNNLSTTTIAQFPESHNKINRIFPNRSTSLVKLTPKIQSPRQSIINTNFSAAHRHIFLPKNSSGNLAFYVPTTYRPPMNHTIINMSKPLFLSFEREITPPKVTDTNNTLVKEANNSERGHLPSAASRISFVEATPIPKLEQIFPALTPFTTYTSPLQLPTSHKPTTIITPPPHNIIKKSKPEELESESIKQSNADSESLMARHVTRPQPPSLMKIRKRQEIMMPGRWNYRTIIKPPQIESDSDKLNTKNNGKAPHIISHNQFKVRYNVPPRKVIHMNRPTPQPALVTENISTVTTPLPITTTISENNNHSFITLSPAEVDITLNLPATTSRTETQETQTVVFVAHPTSNMESKMKEKEEGEVKSYATIPVQHDSTTEITTSTDEIPTTPQMRKTQIYNSIQRLRNLMATRRKNTTPTTARTIFTTESTQAKLKQTEKFMTNVSTSITNTTSGVIPRLTLTPAPIDKASKLSFLSPNFRSFSAYRTHPANRETSSTLTTIRHTTSTTMKPFPITTTPRSTVMLNFEDINNKHQDSDSSSQEWHQPAQEKLLQDHPEMINFYKWESSRLHTSEEHNDSRFSKDQAYSQRDTDVVLPEASNVFAVAMQPHGKPFRADVSKVSRLVEDPSDRQIVLSPHYTSIARNTPKVQEVTASGYSDST